MQSWCRICRKSGLPTFRRNKVNEAKNLKLKSYPSSGHEYNSKSLYSSMKTVSIYYTPLKPILGLSRSEKLSNYGLRSCASGNSNPTNIDKKDSFRVVFRFPYTPIITLVCRGKIYMTSFVCLLSPPGLIYSTLYDNIDLSYILSTVSFCAFSISTLVLFGEFFRRFVGLVSINQDNTKVRLSHVTFWGRRNDVVVPLEDILPLSETSERARNEYWQISFYENSCASKVVDRSKLIISTKYGGIKDEEALERIFGEEILFNSHSDKFDH